MSYQIGQLKCTGNWGQDCWSRPISSAFDPFVSFVVKQSCASTRGLALHLFSLSYLLETIKILFLGKAVTSPD